MGIWYATGPWWYSNKDIHYSDGAVLYRKDKKHVGQFKHYDQQYAEYFWSHQIYDNSNDITFKQSIQKLYHNVDHKERQLYEAYHVTKWTNNNELIKLCNTHSIHCNEHKRDPMYHGKVHKTRMLATSVKKENNVMVHDNNSDKYNDIDSNNTTPWKY